MRTPDPRDPPNPQSPSLATSGHSPTHVTSLRGRLLLLLIGSVLLVWLVALGAAYVEAHHELDELFDRRLAQTARTLLNLKTEEIRPHGSDGDDGDVRAPDESDPLEYQVWRQDGHLLLRSDGAPDLPFDPRGGYVLIENHGGLWQTYSLWRADRTVQVRVFDDERKRRRLTAEIIGRVALPLALSLPLLAAIIWLAIGRGLAPLRMLSHAVSARNANHLAPLVLEDIPDEARPLVLSLNALLARLARSLDAERRFTADAAHELRTPLAAIRAQAQVALTSDDAQGRQHALTRIVEGTDRATRLAVQLLTLARADSEAPLPYTIVDLVLIARRCVAQRAESALSKGQDLSLHGAGVANLAGDTDLLEALCGNLIDNAIACLPDGGHIEVSVDTTPEGIRFEIRDDGPGVDETHRTRLLNRFYRAPGNISGGSGLGLSIAQQIARRHHATLILTDGLSGRGFGVRVDFPVIKS